MKSVYSILLSTLITMPAHAEILNLYIENSSNTPIVVEKADGKKIPVSANQTIANIPLERNSQVKNYVNGKLACTWEVSTEGMPPQWKLIGLYYQVYGTELFCGKIAQ